MNDLEKLIVEEIESGGPMDFARFMELALYHPEFGYYSSGHVRSDWNGDFITSPEIDPAFGGLWARGIEEIWASCGCPEVFTVAEIGPGEGGFASGLLSAVAGSDLENSLRYISVERVPALRARQRERWATTDVQWQDLETIEPFQGVVFANEVLDNTPVHLLRKEDGRLNELRVEAREDGSLGFVSVPPDDALVLPSGEVAGEIPEGGIYEVGLQGAELARRAGALVDRGAVIFVDYGDTAPALARRPQGTCVCFSAQGTDDMPLERPGSKDITAHANWSSITAALRGVGLDVYGPRSQRAVLRTLGSPALDQRLQRKFRSRSGSKDGAAALMALSRRQAIAALTDPGGLGSLGVLTACKGIPAPSFMRGDDSLRD